MKSATLSFQSLVKWTVLLVILSSSLYFLWLYIYIEYFMSNIIQRILRPADMQVCFQFTFICTVLVYFSSFHGRFAFSQYFL